MDHLLVLIKRAPMRPVATENILLRWSPINSAFRNHRKEHQLRDQERKIQKVAHDATVLIQGESGRQTFRAGHSLLGLKASLFAINQQPSRRLLKAALCMSAHHRRRREAQQARAGGQRSV
jgi:hypothetical protein